MKRNNYIKYNNTIRGKVVKVIGTDSKILGSFRLQEAILKAKEQNLDLVQVGGSDNTPVCKMLDYGKYKYKMLKRSKQVKNKKTKVKEVKLRPNTDLNDLNIKLRATKSFIVSGHKVKVSLILRGREAIYESAARRALNIFKNNASIFSRVESSPKKEGRVISMLLLPKNE